MGQVLAVAAELLLLLACVFTAIRTVSLWPLGMLLMLPGALLLGLAALLGAMEYAGLEAATGPHHLSSRLAGAVALPAMMIAPGLAALPANRQRDIALLALGLMICGLLFSVPQIGQVLLVAGLLAAGAPAFTYRGRLLAAWIALLLSFALTVFARSQVDGPLSAGMSVFHLGLATLVSILGLQLHWASAFVSANRHQQKLF